MAITSSKPVVILCDRGAMDGKAYLDENTWQALLDEVGLNTVTLRDKRYDVVIHMVTAAKGAETFYDLDSNPARFESLEEARELDRITQSC